MRHRAKLCHREIETINSKHRFYVPKGKIGASLFPLSKAIDGL